MTMDLVLEADMASAGAAGRGAAGAAAGAGKRKKDKAAKLKAKGRKTLVTLLLDRSGSMAEVHEQTVVGINAYLADLRGSGDDIRFSLVQFDSDHEGHMSLIKTYVATQVAEVPDLKIVDFVPRGGTPLIDAACEVINAVAASLKGKTAKVVMAIQTDGQENISRRNTWAGLRSLIETKQGEGWEFNFMGCGIDAYDQGARMGIAREKIVSYGKDAAATRAAFAATASNTRLFAEGAVASVAYSLDQKSLAGDRS